MLLVGSFSVAGLAILAGILPMLYPSAGSRCRSWCRRSCCWSRGVYYQVEVLPAWLQAFVVISPATYILDGIRGGDHRRREPGRRVGRDCGAGVFGVVLIPGGMIMFVRAERWAKKTGRLKRQG